MPRCSTHVGAQRTQVNFGPRSQVHVGARSHGGAPRPHALIYPLRFDAPRCGANDSVRPGAEQTGGAAALVPRTSASAVLVPRTSASATRLPRISAGRQWLCTLFVSPSLLAAPRRGLGFPRRPRRTGQGGKLAQAYTHAGSACLSICLSICSHALTNLNQGEGLGFMVRVRGLDLRV